jgi:hypothetical protein
VIFLLQHKRGDEVVATLWRDEELTADGERALAVAVFEWLEYRRKEREATAA